MLDWSSIAYISPVAELTVPPRISLQEALELLKRPGRTVKCVDGNRVTANIGFAFRNLGDGKVIAIVVEDDSGYERHPFPLETALKRIAEWDPNSKWVQLS